MSAVNLKLSYHQFHADSNDQNQSFLKNPTLSSPTNPVRQVLLTELQRESRSNTAIEMSSVCFTDHHTLE